MGDEQPVPIAALLRARALDAVRFHPKEVVALVVIGFAIAGGGVLAYARSRPAPAAALAPVAAPSVMPSESAEIKVHIIGAVNRPGVYRFPAGTRVINAVHAAGGFRSEADKAAINLARVLSDGEQVVIPWKGQTAPQPSGGGGGGAQAGGKINLNAATVADLDTLPGIGPVLAQRIIDYRDQHGPFREVKDLLKVPGIGPAKFESLEPMVTV